MMFLPEDANGRVSSVYSFLVVSFLRQSRQHMPTVIEAMTTEPMITATTTAAIAALDL